MAENPIRHQVFAAGKWQDLTDGGQIEVVNEDELLAAQEGRLETRVITLSERRAPRIALCLSTPRLGFLRPFHMLLNVANQFGVSVFSGDGVFWHHALSRSIENACNYYFEDTGEGFDFILTADYDSYVLPDDLTQIATLLGRSPEADCIVAMQSKRGGTGEILAGGRNLNMTHELVPIETGHFGFTLFRREFFSLLRKPWFGEKADVNGDWGEGRVDADIGFWNKARQCGLKVFLSTRIIVGHGEEVITYPRIRDGKIEKVYQAVNDWLNTRTKPTEIGVILQSDAADVRCQHGAERNRSMPGPYAGAVLRCHCCGSAFGTLNGTQQDCYYCGGYDQKVSDASNEQSAVQTDASDSPRDAEEAGADAGTGERIRRRAVSEKAA